MPTQHRFRETQMRHDALIFDRELSTDLLAPRDIHVHNPAPRSDLKGALRGACHQTAIVEFRNLEFQILNYGIP